ncbi:MAG: hypothetical protein KDK63_02820, partial [Chlamydiia bacterium]|nr:hypothetical protein [Chlamydiia bacterium]
APLEKTIQPPQQVLVDEQILPLEKNEMRYTTLDAILSQLKDPRYTQAVTVNGATWKGPEKLRDKLLEEKYTEEQIIYILNQIEFQTFATPLVDARDKLGKKGFIMFDPASNAKRICVTITEKEVTVSGIGDAVLQYRATTVGTAKLRHETTTPKDPQKEATGSHSCSITSNRARVLYV